MTNITGPFNQFNEAEKEWENYIERFELFLTANNIKAEIKVSTLHACVGPKIYNLLKTLCSPAAPISKSYEVIVKLIKEHLNPAPYFLTERIKFSKRDQHAGESIAEYVVELRKLATHCKFGNNLNEQLRDRFVSGVRNQDAKRKFRAEKEEELTFSEVIEIATGIELMERDSMPNTSSSSAAASHRHSLRLIINNQHHSILDPKFCNNYHQHHRLFHHNKKHLNHRNHCLNRSFKIDNQLCRVYRILQI